MCPYYLDGDLRAAYAALGDTRVIGYCAVFKVREEATPASTRIHARAAGGAPVSQNSTACGPPRLRVTQDVRPARPVDISSAGALEESAAEF